MRMLRTYSVMPRLEIIPVASIAFDGLPILSTICCDEDERNVLAESSVRSSLQICITESRVDLCSVSLSALSDGVQRLG